jgi:hypothetical protein
MKKAPRWALLFGCVAVFLLAWWPWNVWLVVLGAAYAYRLQGGSYRSFLAADPSQAAVGRAQSIEESLIAGDGPYPLQDYARVLGYEHFSDTPRQSFVDGVSPASGTVDDSGVDYGTGVAEWIDTAPGQAIGAPSQPKFGQLPRRG